LINTEKAVDSHGSGNVIQVSSRRANEDGFGTRAQVGDKRTGGAVDDELSRVIRSRVHRGRVEGLGAVNIIHNVAAAAVDIQGVDQAVVDNVSNFCSREAPLIYFPGGIAEIVLVIDV